jgi:hypothetical protein
VDQGYRQAGQALAESVPPVLVQGRSFVRGRWGELLHHEIFFSWWQLQPSFLYYTWFIVNLISKGFA